MLTMLAYIVFFLAISSGSVYGSVRYGRKYEEILPITCMGIVLILFVFGVLGILEIGVLAVMLTMLVLYLLSAVILVKRKNIVDFLSALVTPGSIIFLCACVAFAFLNRGRLAYGWDEFSHWVDIVKAMTTLDDFGTNLASQSAFQSYPPGMSLFQYFLQKILLFFNHDVTFHEPSVYMAYQVFFTAILIPFFKGQSFKRPLRLLLTGTIVFITPTIFFPSLYNYVYIDPILGFLAGAGFAAIFLNHDRDLVYSIYIWMLCASLILVKDSGMLFAILLAVAYCISLLDSSKATEHSTSGRKKCLLAGGAFLSVLLPKLLWSLELKTSGAWINFSGKVDLMKLWQVLIGQDNTYLRTVYENWGNSLFASNVALGHTNIALSYFTLFLVICLFAFYLYRIFNRMESQWKRTRKWVLVVMTAEIVIFVFGLCVMYMFKFSEYEAVRLASFTRYVNTVFLGAWLAIELIAVRAIDFVSSPDKKQILSVTLLLALLATAPVKQLYLFVRGDFVKISTATRAQYATISEKINTVCDGQSTVYFISQENSGLDRWIVRFNVRPNKIAPIPYQVDWSIGEGPFYEGDVWTATMTAEQWQDLLVQKYDYVALYRLNDYFYEHYSVLFEDPATIMENAVYRVDKDTGLLVFCQ